MDIGGLIGLAAGWVSSQVSGRCNVKAAEITAQTERERLAAALRG